MIAARQTGDIVQLEDTTHQTVVSIIPSIGNIAFEMKVRGHNVLRWPYASVNDVRATSGFGGLPFLGPWANRLDEQAFYANGKKYVFDMQLGNVHGPNPLHGFLTITDQWQLIEAASDGSSAWATSRLDFYRQPPWMKQFPFAHTIGMTHRLQNGVLEVQTAITNMAAEPMPVSVGFHPYFQLTDSPRDEWTVVVPARRRWKLTHQKLPTGETEPVEKLFPNGQGALKDYDLDDVFSDLVRDAKNRATVTLKGKQQSLDVVLGPTWQALVIYSPGPADFICLEPMAGITNSMNLAQRGVYKEQQYIEPGGTWEAGFWIKPSGFEEER